jgi:hypothetical protein
MPHDRTGIEELRHLVEIFNACNETFNDPFTAEELIRLYRVHLASGWDFYPDQWDERQVRDAIDHGIAPRWDKRERPIHTCDHAEGCEADATQLGFDEDGDCIAEMCDRHADGFDDGEAGVERWIPTAEITGHVRYASHNADQTEDADA